MKYKVIKYGQKYSHDKFKNIEYKITVNNKN